MINTTVTKPIDPKVREYFQAIGKKRGDALKKKYGSDYFKRIAGMRKSFGKQKVERNSARELGNRFDVKRQRIYQILNLHGKSFKKDKYFDLGEWREAVVSDFFKQKKLKEKEALDK